MTFPEDFDRARGHAQFEDLAHVDVGDRVVVAVRGLDVVVDVDLDRLEAANS